MKRLAAGLLSIVAGFFLAQSLSGPAANSDEALLQRELDRLNQENGELTRQRDELADRLEGFKRDAEAEDGALAPLMEKLRAVAPFAGLTDMRGPGIVITLSDAPKGLVPEGGSVNYNNYVVHDEDLKRLVNVLVDGGAECVSINDVRILSRTKIRCGGPAIDVWDQILTPPFTIRAIGDPETLVRAITGSDEALGIYQEFSAYGLAFTYEVAGTVEVKGFKSPLRYDYAKAAAIKEE